MPVALGAAAALYDYAKSTQRQSLAHITTIRVEREDHFVRLDAATRRNLELSETLRGEPAPTLFSLLDRCATSMGSRWLRHALHHPLRNRDDAAARHAAIAELIGSAGDGAGEAIQQGLRGIADVERISARVALRNARPRDLGAAQQPAAAACAARVAGRSGEPPVAELGAALETPAELTELLVAAVADEPANAVRDGGVIADGFDAEAR